MDCEEETEVNGRRQVSSFALTRGGIVEEGHGAELW